MLPENGIVKILIITWKFTLSVILNKKKLYHNKKSGKIIGIDIKPQFPKKPDITMNNSFNETSDKIAKKLLKKITMLLFQDMLKELSCSKAI